MNERASEEPDSDILKQIKELMGEGAPVAGGSKANPASQAEVSPGAAIRDELIKILEAARPTDPIPNSAIVDETIKPPVEMPVTEAGASGPTSDAISGSAQTRQWRSWRAHPLFNFIGPIVLVFIGAAIVVVGLGGALFEIWGTRAPSVSISTTRNAAPVPDDIAPQRTAEAETSSPAYYRRSGRQLGSIASMASTWGPTTLFARRRSCWTPRRDLRPLTRPPAPEPMGIASKASNWTG